jgi:hypothetical protein
LPAAMAQDVVSRRHVKKELRHAERQQQRLAARSSKSDKLPRNCVKTPTDD